MSRRLHCCVFGPHWHRDQGGAVRVIHVAKPGSVSPQFDGANGGEFQASPPTASGGDSDGGRGSSGVRRAHRHPQHNLANGGLPSVPSSASLPPTASAPPSYAPVAAPSYAPSYAPSHGPGEAALPPSQLPRYRDRASGAPAASDRGWERERERERDRGADRQLHHGDGGSAAHAPSVVPLSRLDSNRLVVVGLFADGQPPGETSEYLKQTIVPPVSPFGITGFAFETHCKRFALPEATWRRSWRRRWQRWTVVPATILSFSWPTLNRKPTERCTRWTRPQDR